MGGLGIVGVPSSAGAHSVGLEKGPSHLRAAALGQRLADGGIQVLDLGDLPSRRYEPDRLAPANRNLASVVRVATQVREQVEHAFRRRLRPLVIGGDCTITIGAVAAAQTELDRFGLVYIDGHTDLNTPETSRSGILDSMGMAHIVGLGIKELSHIGSRQPLLPPEHVVLFGFDPSKIYGGEERILRASNFLEFPVPMLKGRCDRCAREGLAALEARIDWFLVHLDVDVISFVDFPVADVPQYHGQALDFVETMQALATFAASPKFAGLVITEFNPDMDADGTYARRFVDTVAKALSTGSARWAELGG